MRDGFDERTIRLLAEKAGYICSYPQCRMVTTYPHGEMASEVSGNIGQAAHITAASPGGPRYDASLTHEQRSDVSNGIWMCYSHAKLIDSEKCVYSVDKLRKWKIQHEKDVSENRFNPQNTNTAHSCRYIRELTVKGLGPFVKESKFHFGRYNFIVGGNGSGKTALTQMASWFVGGAAHEYIRHRFLDACANDEASLCVKYGEEGDFRVVKYEWHKYKRRLLLDAKTSFLANSLVVRSGQRAILVASDYERVTKVRLSTGFKHIISGFANLMDMDYDDLLSLIASRGDVETPIGYRLRIASRNKALEYAVHRDDFYQEYNSLSGIEQMLSTLDIALRCVDIVPPSQSWLFIIEHDFVKRLTSSCSDLFSNLVFSFPPNIQLMICALDEKTVKTMIDGREEKFHRSDYNGLSLWRSIDY